MTTRTFILLSIFFPACLSFLQCSKDVKASPGNRIKASRKSFSPPAESSILILPDTVQERWRELVGSKQGIWVCVREQRLRVIERDEVTFDVPCSTASRGIGCEKDSYKTPTGWHSIHEKIGDGAPWGQVFRWRQATSEIWKPGEIVEADLVLTRILTLRGEEPGHNQGGDVDSLERHIYIHGTNDEQDIGHPASYGCIRLLNDDVIRLFDRVSVRTPVLITE